MTLFFPDLNVWLALSDERHEHGEIAWNWMNQLPRSAKLIFARHTQIGLLRLLTTSSVMGDAVLTVGKAWQLYDQWLADPRVEFYPEPRDAEHAFRLTTAPFAPQKTSKAIGDCWLLAQAIEMNARLVTFDRGLFDLAKKQGHAAVIPS